MFRVQQELRTKDMEIGRLEDYNKMRNLGLISSARMLEYDTKSFLEYFTQMKTKTTQASQDLEAKKKHRNELTANSRIKNDEIQNLKTTINKNIENLQIYEQYMQLFNVADKNVRDKFEKGREDRRKAKHLEETNRDRKGKSNERKQAVDDLDFKWPNRLKDLFDLDDETTEYPQPF
jgi:chromosome segregation ATPase